MRGACRGPGLRRNERRDHRWRRRRRPCARHPHQGPARGRPAPSLRSWPRAPLRSSAWLASVDCRAVQQRCTDGQQSRVRLDAEAPAKITPKPLISWGSERGEGQITFLEVRAISFAAEVKNEMAGLLPARPCCQLSELLGVYYGSRGRLLGSPRGRSAYFSLLRNAVARKVVRLCRAVQQMDAKYQAVKTRKRMSFFIELTLPADLVAAFSQPPVQAVNDAACDRKALLRGLFLGCGSVNAPNTRYHLEFVAPTPSSASAIARPIASSGLQAGVAPPGGQAVGYVTD